jgi:hypothetical protein
MLQIQPITFDEACTFVMDHHRHHKPPRGWLFGCAVNNGKKVVGVVMVGRPIARLFDDGRTVEVTRCCTDGTQHAASKLYAAAWRAARSLGYARLITYTLADEPGTSLKAAGLHVLHQTRGGSWSRPSRPRVDKHPTVQKQLWEVK